jgi:MOSC domain-containing protein YiiM
MGRVLSINISSEKGKKKTPIDKARIIEGYGIEGDVHAGRWHRQISLLSKVSIDKMGAMVERKGKSTSLNYGDFAENLTIEGVDLLRLPIGATIKTSDGVILEVTQIGKKCHTDCEIYRLVGDCVMPREGIFARVIKGGEIKIDDEIEVIEYAENRSVNHKR